MPASETLSKIPFSILDLAIIREGYDAPDAFRRSIDLAQHVENWGYKRFWLAEHHNMSGVGSSATAVLIGYIAGGTKTINVGSGGIMLPNHTALMVAEQFGTLESLYPGRINLGLGRAPGTDQLTAAALRRGRVETFQDFPTDLAALQTYFSTENNTAKVRAIPGEGLNIPIFILGSSMASAVLASEKGLPYAFASHFAPAQFLSSIKFYRENFQPSKYLQQPYVISCVNIIAADETAIAEKLATSFYQMIMGITRGISNPMKPAIETMQGVWTADEEVAVQNMMACTFIGSKALVQEELEDFLALTKVDELMVSTNVYEHSARLHSYKLLAEIFTK